MRSPSPSCSHVCGGAVGVRSVAGNEAVAANSDRSGFELRAFWEGVITPTWSWRAEVAGTQMQFRRDDGTQRFAVSENGIEVSAAARASFGGGSLSGLYGLAGPVYSLRVLCGTLIDSRLTIWWLAAPTPQRRVRRVWLQLAPLGCV